jgi:hypothetical protein
MSVLAQLRNPALNEYRANHPREIALGRSGSFGLFNLAQVP